MSISVEAIYGLGVSHNKYALPLPDGTYYPDYAPGGVENVRALEFLTHFNRVREKDWADCTFLDLGCSEGSTTFALSQTGATVYGVEGRSDGVDRANVLREIIRFNNTHFSVGNVDHEQSFREVDGIFNAGVLYHLEDPILCLERCAKYARSFVFVDTGHAPRSEDERKNSKFARNFGRSYQVDWRDLKIDMVDFAEPRVAEKSDGVRRGPRSGIGNTNSVWLAHHSLIDLMDKLGFPYHETVADKPRIPRLRTCFFRTSPKPKEKLGPMAKPLPSVLPKRQAIANARLRDVNYLRQQNRPVLLVGRDPTLSEVRNDLRNNGISVSSSVVIPGVDGERFNRRVLSELLAGKCGLVVAADTNLDPLIDSLMRLDRFEYVFSSFAMARVNGVSVDDLV